MLNYSYKTQLKKIQYQLKEIDYQLLLKPNNSRLLNKKESLQNEYNWFKEQIDKGNDPGKLIL